MIQWQDDMVLYHGSYCVVRDPQLSKCSPFKDFGLGFYVTTSREQAIRFIPSAIKKAIRLGAAEKDTLYGYVTAYRFSGNGDLKCMEYATADSEWLHCIAAHRKSGVFLPIMEELKQYDLIAGKIANDQTNATLTAYLAGLYGEIGSAEADQGCISRLLPERLENQICLRTQKALDALTYIGEEQIWIRER